MFKHILVPTDGSELSQQSVKSAVMFAKEINAKITFFCAQQSFPTMYYGMGAIFDPHTPAMFHEEMEDVANMILDNAEKLANETGVESKKFILISSEPYEAIIKAADMNGCDLIFMASHGRHGIDGILLGSETQKVLTHSKIPVLVYR